MDDNGIPRTEWTSRSKEIMDQFKESDAYENYSGWRVPDEWLIDRTGRQLYTTLWQYVKTKQLPIKVISRLEDVYLLRLQVPED